MSWTIRDHELRHREVDLLGTLFCVGNGRHCTRGTAPEAGGEVYRGVFVSGFMTRAPLGLMYFCGAPDWLAARVDVDGRPAECEQDAWELDMYTGTVTRRARFVGGDTVAEVTERRFASWADDPLAAQQLHVVRKSGGGELSVAMGIDADIRQSRAKYYQPGDQPAVDERGLKLTEIESLETAGDAVFARLISPATGRRSAVAAAIRSADGAAGTAFRDGGVAGFRFTLAGDEGRFEKLAAIVADLEGFEDAAGDLERHFRRIRAQSWEEAHGAHCRAMERFWDLAAVDIDGDDRAQQAVRFAVWSTRHSAPLDDGGSSVGAKNLTGDWYRGAVFWDFDIFQLPLLAAVDPPRARNHVRFRTRRLGGARQMARQDGYRGARYPGQSYAHGVEDPPCLRGLGRMEIHVTFDVAWGILHYAAVTGDVAFLLDKGLEVVLEATRFWSSRVEQDEDGSRHLRSICGPDELHKPVDDNAYMNHMIAELMRRANAAIEQCRSLDARRTDGLLEDLGIDAAERETWDEIAERMHIPMLDARALEQFAGHSGLPIASPRAVAEEGMGADRIGKQADTTLLFQTMPWRFDREQTLANYRMYAPLCNQTSSLSLCTHALVAGRLGLVRDAARYFGMAAGVDLDDSMGNSVHGIHGAGEGGIWLAVVWGFGGLTVSPDGVSIAPHLPAGWTRLRYAIALAGSRIDVLAEPDGCTVTNTGEAEATLSVGGRRRTLAPGESVRSPVEGEWRRQGLDGVVFDDEALICDGELRRGASELLDGLREAGVPTAVVSAAELDEATLAAVGLAGRIDAVVDGRFIRRPKPDPEGALTATQHLLALPWNCVGIGADADAVDALRRGGLAVLGLGADAPQGRIEDLSEATVETLAPLPDAVAEPVNPYLERNIAIVEAEQTGRS